MERHAPALQLDLKTKRIAHQMLVAVERNGLNLEGHKPQAFAGAAIYLAGKRTGLKLTQTAICDQLRVSDQDVRTTRCEIRRYFLKIHRNGD